MGVALELGVLLGFSIVAQSMFGRFEIETAPVRKILKWSTMSALTVLLYRFVGHWSLLLPASFAALGTTFHFVWCRRNGIDPMRATPSQRYYQLRGWRWPADASS